METLSECGALGQAELDTPCVTHVRTGKKTPKLPLNEQWKWDSGGTETQRDPESCDCPLVDAAVVEFVVVVAVVHL